MKIKKALFRNKLLEEMRVEGTIFPENASQYSVSTLLHQDGSAHVLRIYQLLFNNYEEAYEPVQELALLGS